MSQATKRPLPSILAWSPRRFLRKHVSADLRLRRVLLQRKLTDRLRRVLFADTIGSEADFPYVVCTYERPFIDYPGQEQVAQAKRRNQHLAASHVDGVVIRPGDVFSVWHLVPRPTAAEGYAPAAAVHEGVLQMEDGGAICLLSTVLYNVALLGGLRILERHCHSTDQYGATRYFELGRDAAIEHGYLDLRFQNPHDFAVLIRVTVDASRVLGSLHAPHPVPFVIEILVDEPILLPAQEHVYVDATLVPGQRRVDALGRDGLEVSARRRIRTAHGEVMEDLPFTRHQPVAAVVAVADDAG